MRCDKCDKCGLEVDPRNDATLVEAYMRDNPMIVLGYGARHFLPVTEDGQVVCEGSPSRAQYIEGQPRDSRGYPYIKADESRWREAYAAVQADFAQTPS